MLVILRLSEWQGCVKLKCIHLFRSVKRELFLDIYSLSVIKTFRNKFKFAPTQKDPKQLYS
jgi:hypothetical protein